MHPGEELENRKIEEGVGGEAEVRARKKRVRREQGEGATRPG